MKDLEAEGQAVVLELRGLALLSGHDSGGAGGATTAGRTYRTGRAVAEAPGSTTGQTPAVIWFLAIVDLAAGAYLLVYAYRRERRDKPGVLAVGVTLVVCAALLGGLGTWQAAQEPATPVGPSSPDVPPRTVKAA